MKENKSIASLSLDLDNQWSYMKTHGDPGWGSFPSYLDLVVPRILDSLKNHRLTITFFIVGQDAALKRNREALGSIAAAGHEIGNHSFRHEQWLHLYSEEQMGTELAGAEESIELATGKKPIGFRGPGYSLSNTTLECLARRGYLYDSSTFPTFLGPLARAYYFRGAKLSPQQRRERQLLYGSLRDGLRPINPYRWKIGERTLLEIPVTTMPILRIPIHVSYILYLSLFTPSFALQYFKVALKLCRLTGAQLSLILHPLDFLGSDDIENLSFFPAMKLPRAVKLELVSQVLHLLCDQFCVVNMQQHAWDTEKNLNLPIVEPNFPDHVSAKAAIFESRS